MPIMTQSKRKKKPATRRDAKTLQQKSLREQLDGVPRRVLDEHLVDGVPWVGLLEVHGELQFAGYGREAALALVGWAAERGAPALRLGDLAINQAERRVLRAGGEVHLTPTEFDLLGHLLGRPGRVFTREELLAGVWGYASAAGTRTVDVHVAQVRAKLGGAASLIRTVRGVGYTADA